MICTSLVVDQVACRVHQRHMQGDEFAIAQQIFDALGALDFSRQIPGRVHGDFGS